MKDTIIELGKGIVLDGIKLGTASVVGDVLGRGVRKVLRLDEDRDENEKKDSRSHASRLSDMLPGSGE